jgi:hypothetical protein
MANKSAIIYRGPSLIDGAPIVVIAIDSARNSKTGRMVQTYILRADINPRDANKSGADFSICGSCPHRGTPTTDVDAKQAKGRSCYVLLGQGVLIAYRAMLRGVYPAATDADAIAAIGAGAMVRLGTYGDPAAVPPAAWNALLRDAAGHTAYSHQAHQAGAAFDAARFMQSADNETDARDAWAAGRRTFRVVQSVADIVAGSEILCPASKEAGRRVTCSQCKLCGGSSIGAKSIAIPAHGSGAKYAA